MNTSPRTTKGLESVTGTDEDLPRPNVGRAEKPELRIDEDGERIRIEGGDAGYRDRRLAEFRECFPNEYIEPWTRSSPTPPFQSPERVAADINPKYDESDAYKVNCADCARAVERTWRGDVEEAAGRSARGLDDRYDGEATGRTETWADERFASVPVDEIWDRVGAAGHGASAIVHTEFKDLDGNTRGHAYNVVNHHGEVRVIDGQTGQAFGWSEGRGHPRLHEVRDAWNGARGRGRSRVMGWNATGGSLW